MINFGGKARISPDKSVHFELNTRVLVYRGEEIKRKKKRANKNHANIPRHDSYFSSLPARVSALGSTDVCDFLSYPRVCFAGFFSCLFRVGYYDYRVFSYLKKWSGICVEKQEVFSIRGLWKRKNLQKKLCWLTENDSYYLNLNKKFNALDD